MEERLPLSVWKLKSTGCPLTKKNKQRIGPRVWDGQQIYYSKVFNMPEVLVLGPRPEWRQGPQQTSEVLEHPFSLKGPPGETYCQCRHLVSNKLGFNFVLKGVNTLMTIWGVPGAQQILSIKHYYSCLQVVATPNDSFQLYFFYMFLCKFFASCPWEGRNATLLPFPILSMTSVNLIDLPCLIFL